MRKHNITKWLASAALALMSVSCLDYEPQQQLADENFWQSANDFKLFANNFYSYLRDINKTLYYLSDGPNHSDYYSDLLRNSERTNLYSTGSNTVLQKDGNYSGNYSHIRRCNLLLENAAGYAVPADIAPYVGEAYFFRAYSYFELVQLYGDAIIVTEPIEVGDPLLSAPRNDRGEVIDLIMSDLEQATAHLPAAKSITEDGRLSKEAAQAFLSRVALYEGTWQKFRGNTERGTALLDRAATAAYNVIKTGAFQIFRHSAMAESAQKYLFILEDFQCNPAGVQKSANKEYIIKLCKDPVIRPVAGNLTSSILANGMWVTSKMADMYLCQNGLPISYGGKTNPQFKGYDKIDTEWENRDNRMRHTLMKPHDQFWSNLNPRKTWTDADGSPKITDFKPKNGTGYFTQKWCVERECLNGEESYDIPLLRYAEVLLNYAEAVYERDGAISDADLDLSLNQVRLRVNADMPRLSNSLVAANPGLDMRTEIRRERTVELFCEGFRLDDLKRWKTAETEMPMDLTGVVWKDTEFATVWPSCSFNTNGEGRIVVETGRRWAEKNYLNPLPVYELQLNPNLKQNPGWN